MQECLIGSSIDTVFGSIPIVEVGMTIKRYSQSWEDPKTMVTDRQGSPIAFFGKSRRFSSITISGDINSDTVTYTSNHTGDARDGLDLIGATAQGNDSEIAMTGTATAYDGPWKFCQDLAVANLINGYDITTGGVFLDSLTIDLAESEVGTFTAQLSRWPNLTVPVV